MSALLDKAFQKFLATLERNIRRTSRIACLPSSRERAMMYEAWIARGRHDERKHLDERAELFKELHRCPNRVERIRVLLAWLGDDEITGVVNGGWEPPYI